MKKIINLAVFALICIAGLAQQNVRDYKYYSSAIDSVVTLYSTTEYKNYWDSKGIDFQGRDVRLTESEMKEIVNRIKRMFGQKKHPNLYVVGHYMLSDFWYSLPVKKSVRIRRMIIETELQYYFYPYQAWNHSEKGYSSTLKKYFTRKSQNRLKAILKGEKAQKDFKAFELYYKYLPVSYRTSSWEDAARRMKKRGIKDATVLKHLRDSLFNDYLVRYTRKNFESVKISYEMIKMIGFLGMKDCIPILQEQLDSCAKMEECSTKGYRYALAKLGNEEQSQYILDSLMDYGLFNRIDFAYFRDDRFIWRYIDVNYVPDRQVYLFDKLGWIGLKVMNNIYPFVKDVPKELQYFPASFPNMEDYYKWAKAFHDWMLANKDKIKFQYTGEEKWDW